jgi:hypothetical protein
MDAKKLIALINESGDFAARSYSGRAMYGRRCVGVTCTNQFKALASITEGVVWDDEPETMREWIETMDETRIDSMGIDVIIYWPRIEWPADVEENDDEEIEE